LSSTPLNLQSSQPADELLMGRGGKAAMHQESLHPWKLTVIVTKKTILKHLRTSEDRRAAESAMREMHRLLQAYAEGLARRHLR
jgi:hypothetical protein